MALTEKELALIRALRHLRNEVVNLDREMIELALGVANAACLARAIQIAEEALALAESAQ